jgi:hypothetical protein
MREKVGKPRGGQPQKEPPIRALTSQERMSQSGVVRRALRVMKNAILDDHVALRKQPPYLKSGIGVASTGVFSLVKRGR